MKCKLVKTESTYYLVVNDKIIASMGDSDGKLNKLSFNNCLSIELGCDLDVLSENHAEEIYVRNENDYNELANFENRKRNFEDGFKKAIEILGNKNFNRQDIIHALTYGVREAKNGRNHSQILEEYRDIHLQQQTEFDVEIITEVIDEGFPIYHKPKLDENNCLILKNK